MSCAPIARVAASASASHTATALADALADAQGTRDGAGAPFVLNLGAAAPILPRWTPAEIGKRVQSLRRVYTSLSPRFGPYHDQQRPFARHFRLEPMHNYSEVELRPHDFFAAAGKYKYYSGEVERDLPREMLEELEPLAAALIAHAPQRSSVNLWLGGPQPVVAPCHYDGYHNMCAMPQQPERGVARPTARLTASYQPLHMNCACTAGTCSCTAPSALCSRRRVRGRCCVPIPFCTRRTRSARRRSTW